MLLGERMHLDPGRLVCAGDPVSLYELSGFMEGVRCAMGDSRIRLMRGTVDRDRCLNVIGMVSAQRPRELTLRQILHAAWRTDSSAVDARGLVERWADGVALKGGGR